MFLYRIFHVIHKVSLHWSCIFHEMLYFLTYSVRKTAKTEKGD